MQSESGDRVLFRNESYAISGAVFEVYHEMGCGFLEAVYQECLERELARRGIPFRSRPEVRLQYKGDTLVQTYQPDIICFDTIIVELKAVSELAPQHEAQVLNYLKATGLRLGLLVNFGSHPKAVIKRFVL
jgi:GxxExxY protein